MAKQSSEKNPERVKGKVMDLGGNIMEEGNPQQAPEKKELTEAEKALHQRRVILSRTSEAESKMEELIEKMKEKDLHLYSYQPDSEVTIPGQMFADILNLLSACAGHIGNQKLMLNDMVIASESLYLGAFEAQLDLSRIHIENCEKGVTISPEEKAKLDEAAAKAEAKNNIKKKGKKKKATGSK